jgi:cytochrome c oxidase subunit 5b
LSRKDDWALRTLINYYNRDENKADRCLNKEIKDEADLLPPGAAPGTVPTDLEQATGLERLEILGKMQGVDVFDMKPLDSSRKGTKNSTLILNLYIRDWAYASPIKTVEAGNEHMADQITKGTMDNPIKVKSFGDEQYCGCTGYPAESHVTIWLTVCTLSPSQSPSLFTHEPTNPSHQQISRNRPIERCPECGNVYEMEYVGPAEDPHAHDHAHDHGHTDPSLEEPKTFADFVKPEYR